MAVLEEGKAKEIPTTTKDTHAMYLQRDNTKKGFVECLGKIFNDGITMR